MFYINTFTTDLGEVVSLKRAGTETVERNFAVRRIDMYEVALTLKLAHDQPRWIERAVWGILKVAPVAPLDMLRTDPKKKEVMKFPEMLVPPSFQGDPSRLYTVQSELPELQPFGVHELKVPLGRVEAEGKSIATWLYVFNPDAEGRKVDFFQLEVLLNEDDSVASLDFRRDIREKATPRVVVR